MATRATPGREVLISGWVGYTLTNCLPARRRGSRAEGDLSPLKGLRFCRTPLPHSLFSLSLSLSRPDNALVIFRACAPRHAQLRSFFRCSLMPYRTRSVSLRRAPDWKANLSPATSFFASPHPVSVPEYSAFCSSRRDLVKHTKLPLVISFFYGF